MAEILTNLLLTFLVALAAGLLIMRTPLPAGGMIGAMLGAAVFSILSGRAYMPQEIRTFTQIVVGAMIGTKLKRSDLRDLRRVILPIGLMIVLMMALSAGMGVLLWRISSTDLLTALFCAAPGGIADMTLAGQELGADTSKIVMMQMARLIAVIGTFPPLLKLMLRRMHKEPVQSEESVLAADTKEELPSKERYRRLLITFLVALPCGLAGYFLKIPAGVLVFSMTAVVVYNLASGKAYMPVNVKKGAQILAGAVVGARMTMTDFLGMGDMFLSLIVLILSYLGITFLLSFLFHKVFHMDLATAMFAFCPGGSTDMALVAEDMGAQVPIVVVSQSLRVILVIALFPLLSQILSNVI